MMCDFERMFHQFRVRTEDQDYLRFLWWNNGDVRSEPSVYRMKVHLFGAASSPGCAKYGLKHVAAQGHGRFNETSIRFIERNFYVDDGLISVSTDEEAIQLVSEPDSYAVLENCASTSSFPTAKKCLRPFQKKSVLTLQEV